MFRPHRAAMPSALLSVVSLAFTAIPTPSFAQTATVEFVRGEIQQMRRDYESRLKALENRLKEAETAAHSASEKAADAEQKATAAASAPPPPAVPASASAFNPAIGVVLDGKFTSYSKNPDTYRLPGFALGDEAGLDPRGFGLGESEVNFSANVDQWLYGNLTVSFAREGDVSVEEAFMQTTALPYGFTAKAGRFFSGIGYLNEQHSHVWDFADAPLPYRAFLNKQLGDDGIQVRWLAPTPFFLEVGGEAFRGDSFPAGGAANSGVGTYSVFAHVGDDIGLSHSFRAGLSWLHTKASDRETDSEFGTDVFNGRSDTGIIDVVYKWAPNGNPVETNLKLQGEGFLRKESGTFNDLGYSSGLQSGWYFQAIYQFMPRWRVGYRHDEVSAPLPGDAFTGTVLDPMGATPRRNSWMIDYSTSEFGRYRFQYNRDESRPEVDNQFITQYTVSLGSHGAHSY
jgi:hypothetical protein